MGSATVKDVAMRAGVSTATVSRVISGSVNVSQELSERVKNAAKELDYYPNVIARSLKTDSTSTIAYIVSDISNAAFTAMAKAIEDIIEPKGYMLLMCSTDHKSEKERRYLRLAQEKKVEGIIINTTGKNNALVASMSQRIPMVLSNRRVDEEGFHGDFVDNDNYDGAFSLTKHLIELGHRRIGAINGDLSLSTGRERYAGHLEALRKYGLAGEGASAYMYEGYFSAQDGYRGGEYLMSLSEPPTAIVVMNNEMLIGALRFFREAGIQIPQNLSVVSYGNIVYRDLFYVQPTYATLDPASIGKRLGELLVERIDKKNELANREVRFVPHLVLGNSTAPLE